MNKLELLGALLVCSIAKTDIESKELRQLIDDARQEMTTEQEVEQFNVYCSLAPEFDEFKAVSEAENSGR